MNNAALERFHRFAEPEPMSGCWIWTGSQNAKGYGYFWDGERVVKAHRASYEHHRGRIPAGLQIDHLCRVSSCVNPAHMEAVSPRENTMRGVGPTAVNARKEACKHGHPFDEENTYTYPDGERECRTCRREIHARVRAKRRLPR